jgi:hypothetical protein
MLIKANNQLNNMYLEKGLLILLIFGIVFFFIKRRQHSKKSTASHTIEDDYCEFWPVLDASIADYKEKMLAYIIYQQVIKGIYPRDILTSLEDRYGKAGGRPWLSLPQEWKWKSYFGIRAWMETRKLPFDESQPALHQLEMLLEKEVFTEAKGILDAALKQHSSI